MSKPQRRKGNAKTASSAQAAELLGSGGFVGFDIGISNVFETVDNEFVDLGNDVTILLKKLSKKDPQTREKGLRELIDVVSLKSDEELELIFPYYATALPKLSLDGSPTVRQLSLKCLSFFIGRLKRAAEKHLKKLIPFVLIGSCDTSAVVCGQANELLKSCFPDGKSERVVKLFAEETCIICCNLIARKHNLFAPQKYDDEETATQRECRLTTECLNLLSRLVERHSEIADTVLDIFNNVTQLKKLLAGNSSPLVQAGLLNLAQKLPTTYKLAESTVSHYAVSNLDNADATIGVASFNILHQLLSAHKDAFFAKFDVKKTLIPRLLTIVRKKAIHWRYCGPFLLPSFAAIFDQLSSEDQTVFGLSFLISFADNMPFIVASIPPSSWSSAFGECFKLFLTRVTDPSKLAEQLIPIFLKMIEKADLASEEVQNDFVSLIRWICEKKDSLLAAPHLNSLINTLELNLMNRRPQTDTFMAKIFTMALEDCATFHSDALRKSDCPTSFVTALEDSGDDYFAKISKNIDITNLVNSKERNLSRAELDSLAVIVLRILNLADSNENSTDFRQDLALAVLKLQNSVWNRLDLQTLLRKLGLDVKDTQVFLTLMKIDNGHLDLLVHILTSCQECVQAEIVSSILESGDGQNVTFILKAMNAITMNSRTRKDVSLWLWEQFFDADSDENLEELVQAIQTKEWQPERSMIAEYLPHLFSNMPTSYSFTKNSTLNHSFLLERIKVLCKVSPTMLDSFLVSSDFFSFTVKNIDHQFAGREIVSLTPFIRQPEVGSSSPDRDILETVGQLSRSASLFMDILDERGRCDAQTLAYLQLVHGAVIILKKTQFYQNRYLDVEKTIEKHLVKNSEQTSQTIPVLLEHPTSSIAHYALSNLQRLLPDAIEQLPEDVPLSTLWATRRDCSKIKMNTSERFLTRFFCENTPREFIDQLQQFCGQEGSSWQEDNQLFSVKAKETMSQLNIVTLQAAVDVFEKSYTSLTAELIDFVMCGLVATFETMDEIYTNEESVSLEQDAQFGNAMLLYRTCCDLYRTHGAVVFADWKDFYYPFTTRIIVRIWMRNSFATSSLAARELAVAVNNLAEIPADLSLPGKPRSQLDGYDSETLLLAERCLQGLRADSYLDNFSSMKLLNILATRLYRLENGDWAEEEEITKKGPKSLQVSRVLLSILQDKTPRGFIRFGCFRAALEPLKSDDLTEEEKLKYCEAFPSLIDAVVPELLQAGQDRPAEEIITNDFQGRMAGSVCDYRLNIVYEICALVPAVFRAWYNGLPKAASSIVNKFITDSISRQIITNEFNRVKEQNRSREKTDLLKIRVFPVLRQIMAEYTVEETQMVLTISMPENYPLGLPELDLEKAIVSNARAKKWLLQLTSYLFFQNGSIVQGIIQWKRNVDRDVEGAESCTICLTIVHQNSHQLPKVKCRQCHNKFHSNCLYKWFESSHNTQCPLCRTSFT